MESDEESTVIFESISELIQHNIDWIRKPLGLNCITEMNIMDSEHLETVDLESVKRFPELLVKMNRLEFLTTDSQIGEEEKDYSERAYVVGYLPDGKAEKLYEELNFENCICLYINIDRLMEEEEYTDSTLASRIPVTRSDGKYTTFVGVTERPTFLQHCSWKLRRRIKDGWSLVAAVDPIHGRICDEKDGLYTRIIRILTSDQNSP